MNRSAHRRSPRTAALALAAVASLLALAGCGGGGSSDASAKAPTKLGAKEGKVSILAWPGYVEDGSDDKTVDWVTPFEKQTGCKVTTKVYGTSDEAFNLAKNNDYDVIAASGDLSLRLVASKQVAPVNTKLVPNYAGIYSFLKNRAWNTVNGVNYGIPHGYGANLLMYNTDVVKPAPTSWSAVFTDASKYKGKVSAYDSPIYIADAALYLMKHDPSLGITNPYALDEKQLDAAVKLLKAQRASIGEYWSDYTKLMSAFTSGNTVVSTSWQVIVNSIDKKNIKAILPSEGATGWNDTWMVGSSAKHPNCAYAWLNWISSPKINAQATSYFGESPNSDAACAYAGKAFCAAYHAGDKAYADKIWFWTTPTTKCLDGRKVKCASYAEWTTKWQEIKG